MDLSKYSEMDLKIARMIYNIPEEDMLRSLRVCIENRNKHKETGVYYGPTSSLAASYRKSARDWILMLRVKRQLEQSASMDDVKKYKLDVPPTSDEF